MSKLRAFTMPKWGIEMVEGTISEWSVKEGEPVAKGQSIVLIETDKIVNEVEAETDARFVRIVAGPGSTMPVGALLAVTADGEASKFEIDTFISSFNGEPAPGAVDESIDGQRVAAADAAKISHAYDGAVSPAAREFARAASLDLTLVNGSGRRGRVIFQDVVQASRAVRVVGGGAPVSIMPTTAAVDNFYASPAAARLAVARGVDLGTVRGSGPRGRISRRDIALEVKVVRMSPMRKAIARQLSLSKSTVPHFYVRLDVNFDALLNFRAKQKRHADAVPGLNDFLVKATALALMKVPDVNIQVHGEEIRQFATADISVAVATDRGLITPVLRAVEGKTVQQVSLELRPLLERARSGGLRAQEIEGGSFSISNLGMFGVEQFDAIINIPQGAILAIGATRRACIENGTGWGFASIATLSLSCDHRAIDGAVAGRFLTTLRSLIESPEEI